MALKKSGPTKLPLIINLSNDKELDSDLCIKMVIGIIKHILYSREQIPQPFEQLNSHCDKSKVPQIGTKEHFHNLKVNAMVHSLTELFNHLVVAMETKRIVERIVVILGSTFLCPREIHCIEIPHHKVGRTPLASLDAKQKRLSDMFRSLFVSSGAVRWPALSPTNVHIMLEMKADPDIRWFLPKTYYSLPENASRLTIYRWTDTSCEESPGTEQTIEKSPGSDKVIDKTESNASDGVMWYLTPISIKGFS